MAGAPNSTGEAEEFSRENYEYMMQRDVPGLIDGVCRPLLTSRPTDALAGTVQYLQALRHGSHIGGVVVAGQNVGGGWLRVVDPQGNVTCEVDKLNFAADKGIQLIGTSPRDHAIYVAVNNQHTATSGVIQKYDLHGELVATIEISRPVNALHVDRKKGHVWVSGRGGGLWEIHPSGSVLNEYPIPTAFAIHVDYDANLLLVHTAKAIERRTLETAHLESATHLPETMTQPSSFAVGQGHMWTAAANPDGTANFVGAYNLEGKIMTNFVATNGCLLAYDDHHGGVWQLPRQTQGTLAMHNERGAKVMSMDIGRSKTFNLCADKATGCVWVLKVDVADDTKLALFDPIRQVNVCETFALPAVQGTATHMVPI